MLSIKTLVSKYSQTRRKPPINPFEYDADTPVLLKSWLISLATHKPISILAQSETPTTQKTQKPTPNGKSERKSKKPLDVVFREAVGLCERTETNESEIETNEDEDAELKKKLWDLEMELRQLKAKSQEQGSKFIQKLDDKLEDGSKSKPKSLHKVFVGDNGGSEKLLGSNDVVLFKELSKDMQVLLKYLYDRGYFKGANFIPENKFDVSYFDSPYARDFLKCAVERFGKDNKEISQWLSGSDLKTVALFGCPSMKKREVFAAKRLRTFFGISEETVCSKCRLKGSCKFVNQTTWSDDDTENLRLDLLMRLLSAYSLEDLPAELKLTDDAKASVGRLIHDVVSLTNKST